MNKKELQKKINGNGKSAYESVIEELQVLQLLEHPNVIWLNEIIDDPKKDKLYVVTEWYSKGSLGDLVASKNKKVGLAPSAALNYLRDMLKALYYCHNVVMAPAKVIHRDIKPDNIMINHNNEAVLIDFGVSALVEEDAMQTNMGSLMFFAPEMFLKKKSFKGT